MDFVRVDDLKPTWDIVKFDEGIEDIPCFSKSSYCGKNPLDRNVVLLFEPEQQEYVYYLPKTGQVIVTGQYMYGNTELTKAFGTRVSGCFLIKKQLRAVRTFLYEMVIGEYLVYRCFEIATECKKVSKKEYSCAVLPAKEIKRYVFHRGGVFVEDRNHTKTVTTVDRIACDEAYDTLQDADGQREFVQIGNRGIWRNF